MQEISVKTGRVEVSDGLSLHWEAHGSGPAMVCCNGVGVSTFFWKYVLEEFSSDHTVVLWDYRGHGASDRLERPEQCDLSITACAEDLFKVLDEAGVETAVALGHSMGCQVALEAALIAPARIDGLVLMQGSAGRVLDTFFDSPKAKQVHRLLLSSTRYTGRLVNRINRLLMPRPFLVDFAMRFGLVDPYYTKREDFSPYLDHMATLDVRLFLLMVQEAHDHNAFARLPEIEQPTLVVAAEKDTFTPMWLSKRIARELPNAEILVLADATHAAIIEQPHVINSRLRRFLAPD